MNGPEKLELDGGTMRRLGYRVVDLIVDRIVNLAGEPAWRRGDRVALERALREPPPAAPQDFEAILAQLTEHVLPYGARVDHPRFFGFVPGSPTWPGVLADFIAAGHNIFQGSWLGGAGASEVEIIVLDWFREWIGFPAEATGLFTSGGSAANLIAIACARQLRFAGHSPDAVIYLSQESHSSVERAARILGFRPDRVRKLPVDDRLRLDLAALQAAVNADLAAGLQPFMVIANAGTTSTGAVDPLAELAGVCRADGLWLHVDAAYGGFAVLTTRGRSLLAGLDAADSVTLDPHKWLFQPFEAGCLLVRSPTALEDAFRVLPDYLQDAVVGSGDARERPVNFMDRGLQLTRSARALKVWMSLKYFGVEPFRQAIDDAIDHTLRAEHALRESGEFEILSPATLGVVCFRRVVDDGGRRITDEAVLERINTRLTQDLAASGTALISSTRVRGRYALRFCILSHRTRWEDVASVIEWFRHADTDADETRTRAIEPTAGLPMGG
jgi:glutamate/tyrosine decarboxylase-like PLP-dependent enzyme